MNETNCANKETTLDKNCVFILKLDPQEFFASELEIDSWTSKIDKSGTLNQVQASGGKSKLINGREGTLMLQIKVDFLDFILTI